jgi:thiol:disulfide interchange protein DsbD
MLALAIALLGMVPAPRVLAAQDDPFDVKNKLPDKARLGKQPSIRIPIVSPLSKRSAAADRIDFDVSITPKQGRRGETVRLTIRGIPKPGFHTYPITQRADNQNQTEEQLSQLTYSESQGVMPLPPLEESDPQWENAGLGPMLVFNKPFTWTQDILILENAKPGNANLAFTIRFTICDDKSCLPPSDQLFTQTVEISDQPPVAISAALRERMGAAPPAVKIVAPPEAVVADKGAGNTQPAAAKAPDMGLIAFILQGVFWGAISLVTPCVFPMIPITVSYFLKQSEKEHHRPITMAVVYCATLVVVLTVAAIALLSTLRGLSVSPLMNFGLGLLFIFFALSLFGMYEIELPSGLAQFTSSREGKGGLVGTMFMALTFTIISFACVAPFLGGFGGTADVAQLTFLHRFLGGLAFSVTFASPFFVLALFPALLKRMPKSGNWLNSVKVVMGFLELAAAIKFLRMAELILLPQPLFLTYDFVLGLYVALSLLCGLYLLNVYRLPHDTPSDHLGVMRLMLSLAFLGLALYLAPGLFKDAAGKSQRPSGAVFAWLDSFLLPDPSEDKELPWVGTLDQGIEDALKRQRLVFLDFTGETCTNCKLNEANVFPKPEIKRLLNQYSLVQLYTDKVPNKYYSPEQRTAFGNSTKRQRDDAKQNLDFQRQKFNTEQLPLYVILRPRSDKNYDIVSSYDEGKINDEEGFARFLREPLSHPPANAVAQK